MSAPRKTPRKKRTRPESFASIVRGVMKDYRRTLELLAPSDQRRPEAPKR